MISNEQWHNQLANKKNKPLFLPRRTAHELADEFGMTYNALYKIMKKNNAPEPVLKCTGTRKRVYWYDHQQMREWYKNYLASKNK
jgi:hypothetical protein